MRLSTTQIFLGGIVLVCLIAFGMTMARYVMNTDNGELLIVSITWGTAHPTGYPLFTFLGFLFSKIPTGIRPLLQLNFLSVIYCASAIGVFFLSIQNFLIALDSGKGENRDLTSALVGSLVLAFSITFWTQSSSYEVYSLHCLFLSLILWRISAIYVEDQGVKDINWLFLALALGFSFTNHLSTIVFLPGLLVLFFQFKRIDKSSFLLLSKMAGVFVLPILAFYGLLWIRATQDPLFNWGDPSSIHSLFRHISGAQYQVWMFESSEISISNLKDFLSAWPEEFSYLSWTVALTGCYFLWNNNRRILWLTLSLFLGNVLYVINYSIHDLEPYFLLAYFVSALWAGIGFYSIAKRLDRTWFMKVGFGLLLLAPQILLGYGKVDRSDYDLIENYSRKALNSLPENSILISKQWDIFNSPCYYLQYAENVRPDVQIFGKELLRRSWYFDQLNAMYPETMKPLDPTVAEFLKALKPFEHDENFDAALLSRLYQKIFAEIIDHNLDSVPIYIGPEIFIEDIRSTREWAVPENINLYPEQYFIRISSSGPGLTQFNQDYGYAYNDYTDVYSTMIKEKVSRVRIFQALFLLSTGKEGEARMIARDIAKNHREMALPQSLMQIL